MKVIIDACSAILLGKASVLESCTEYHNIFMTESVYEEVIAGKEKMFQDALLVERLKENKKLKIIKEDQTITQKFMQDFNMGKGEASIVAIAIKEKESIIFTDNRQGRKAAIINNLPLAGSIEMVIHLYQKKKISREKAVTTLRILKEEGWFEPYLIEKAMEDIS